MRPGPSWKPCFQMAKQVKKKPITSVKGWITLSDSTYDHMVKQWRQDVPILLQIDSVQAKNHLKQRFSRATLQTKSDIFQSDFQISGYGNQMLFFFLLMNIYITATIVTTAFWGCRKNTELQNAEAKPVYYITWSWSQTLEQLEGPPPEDVRPGAGSTSPLCRLGGKTRR